MKWLLITAALCFFASPAFADDKPNCDDPQSTADENTCNDLAFQKADKELNEVWPKVKAWAEDSDSSDDQQGKHYYADTILASQRAWIAYRDAECMMAGLQMHGGSGEGPLVSSCRADLTEQRVKHLKEFLPQ